jgi:hypothetical protein
VDLKMMQKDTQMKIKVKKMVMEMFKIIFKEIMRKIYKFDMIYFINLYKY